MNLRVRAGIAELEVRRTHLYKEIARPREPELQALLAKTLDQLEAIEAQIRDLVLDRRYQAVDAQPAVIRLFREIVRELDRIESFPMVALARWRPEDARLTRFTRRVCQEIGFPRPQPVVVGLSQSYYESFPRFNLVITPAAESSFLLHLPDIYHELCHILLSSARDPRSAPALSALSHVTRAFTAYCLERARREASSSRPPHRLYAQFHRWAASYPKWAVELACDIFAIATCGPAFARAHTHLWTKRGRDPWEPTPGTHPADAARHECMVAALRLCGFTDEADDIQNEWKTLTASAGYHPSAAYRRCFSSRLLDSASTALVKGFREVGVQIVTPSELGAVATQLNDAWKLFGASDSKRYRTWELETGEELFK